MSTSPTMIAPQPAPTFSKRMVRQSSRKTIRPKQTPDAGPPSLDENQPLSSELRWPASAYRTMLPEAEIGTPAPNCWFWYCRSLP
jgi:hypothetical protein